MRLTENQKTKVWAYVFALRMRESGCEVAKDVNTPNERLTFSIREADEAASSEKAAPRWLADSEET